MFKKRGLFYVKKLFLFNRGEMINNSRRVREKMLYLLWGWQPTKK